VDVPRVEDFFHGDRTANVVFGNRPHNYVIRMAGSAGDVSTHCLIVRIKGKQIQSDRPKSRSAPDMQDETNSARRASRRENRCTKSRSSSRFRISGTCQDILNAISGDDAPTLNRSSRARWRSSFHIVFQNLFPLSRSKGSQLFTLLGRVRSRSSRASTRPRFKDLGISSTKIQASLRWRSFRLSLHYLATGRLRPTLTPSSL
jgi:hypothetical protein